MGDASERVPADGVLRMSGIRTIGPAKPRRRRRRIGGTAAGSTLGASVAIALLLALAFQGGTAAASSVVRAAGAKTPFRDSPRSRKEARLAGSTAAGILRTGNAYATSRNYNRYQYIVVGPADASRAASLKARSFVYQSAMDVPTGWNAGVSHEQALAHGWLLKDARGNYLKSRGWDFDVADVGNPAFRRAWLENVSALLARSHVDGVFIDTVIADLRTLTGGVAAEKYPTQRSWENAVAGFMAFVGPALKAKGFYVLTNANKYVSGDNASDNGSSTAAWWRRIGPSVSGLANEYFVQNPATPAQLRGLGSEWYNHWDGWQRLVSVAQRVHADFFGVTYASSTNMQAMRYAKASFLLDWDGHGGGLFIDCGCPDPWNGAWTANIGAPHGRKFQRRPGVWQRNYRRGTVVVNATGTPVSVSIRGSSYTIAPADALILGRSRTSR